MSEPMVTRVYVSQDGAQFPAGWMLKSARPGEPRGPIATIQGGIQFFVTGPEGRVVHLDLDVHDAGELYAALEAHMENITEAAPITPEERERLLRKGRPPKWDEIRRRNLKAIQDEIDKPLEFKPRRMVPVPEDVVAAADDVVQAWTNNGPHARVDHARRVADVRDAFPGLAGLLDRLANLNA